MWKTEDNETRMWERMRSVWASEGAVGKIRWTNYHISQISSEIFLLLEYDNYIEIHNQSTCRKQETLECSHWIGEVVNHTFPQGLEITMRHEDCKCQGESMPVDKLYL